MKHISHQDTQKQRIINATIRAGQDHVFRWWDHLDDKGQDRLLAQLETIDFEQLCTLHSQHASTGTSLPDTDLRPAEVIPLPRSKEQIEAARKAIHVGEDAIRAGKVGAFVVAGGQATRLGILVPKGTFPITPVKEKSLFEHHVEQIRALSARYGVKFPFYIMTSESNDKESREFFEQHDYFGLEPGDVFFFKQEMMPALDFEGKLILDAKDHIFTSPNGHGGSITGLYNSGALDDMRARGIEHIFYFQVDNVLIKIADPAFLGYHLIRKAEMSAKVAPKRDPEEKVGVVCRMGSTLTVIEYSDLPEKHMYARNKDGSLTFSAGNLAIHILEVDLVDRLNTEKQSLPFHIAEKVVPFLDENGTRVKPEKKNGLKFERFVFDALCYARATAIMEVDRDEEFAPVKNAKGEDSPRSAREMMVDLYARWLEKIGARVPRDKDGYPLGPIEISPLYALGPYELRQKLPRGLEVTFPFYLGPD